MSALYRAAGIRLIEQAWIDALGAGELMQRAASAVAREVAKLARSLPPATPIVALVGPGNNGGDALLAAAMLGQRGFPVAALESGPPAPSASDARAVRNDWIAAGRPIQPLASLPGWLAHRPVLIDGLFGIGLSRPILGPTAAAIEALAPAWSRVIAVDVPSGLDADTGCVVGGRDGVAVRAAVTVTMIGDKPGLRTAAGVDLAGRIVLAPLDIARMPDGSALPRDGRLFGADEAIQTLGPRMRNSHKGSFGAVTVIGGGSGTTGAALLAARGAQAIGAGRTWIASPDAPVFDSGQPQLMTRPIDAPIDDMDALCVGCGLGASAAARLALNTALRSSVALVLDADALNLIATDAALASVLRTRGAPTVITPHPLEAARLLRTDTAGVQSDRIASACELSSRLNVNVLLKGAGSIVASPDRKWSLIDAGGPALATAGTGDVLAGVVAALLACGHPAYRAACLGAWAHGAAADQWQDRHPLGIGLSAAALPGLIVERLAIPVAG